jgi:hypothetical protein
MFQWCKHFYFLFMFLEYIHSHRHFVSDLSLYRETYMNHRVKLQMRSKLIVDVDPAILNQPL